MTPTHRARVLFRSIAIFLATGGFLGAAGAAQAPTPAVLVAMKDELDRSIAAMSKGDPAAYFISSTVADRQYRAAGEALIKVRTSQQVQVQTAEGNAPDFSREKPHVSIGSRVEI